MVDREQRSRRSFLLEGGAVLGVAGSVNELAVDLLTTRRIWKRDLDINGLDSSPTVVDATAYISGSSLYAVSANDGAVLWEFDEASGSGASAPAYSNGTVYYGSLDQTLYAVSANDGSLEWSYEADARLDQSSPTVADGTVYVGSGHGDGSLYAIDAETGVLRWRDYVGDSVGAPVIHDDRVYVGTYTSGLHAVSIENGERLWRVDRADYGTTPTVADGTVYATSDDTVLYAVDAETGEELWAHDNSNINTPGSSPTVHEGVAYVGSGGFLYAIDTETGEVRWNSLISERSIDTSPTVAGETVYVGSDEGICYAVDAQTGSVSWEVSLGGLPRLWGNSPWINSSPIVVGGVLFFGASDGALYAFDTETDADSVGSRVVHGSLNHHHAWAGEPGRWFGFNREIRWSTPAVGLAGLGTYGFYRRRSKQASVRSPAGDDGAETDANRVSDAEEQSAPDSDDCDDNNDDSSIIEERQSEGAELLKKAHTAKETANFNEATDAYTEALTQFQAALSRVGSGDTEIRSEIEESIEVTREELESIEARERQRTELIELLNTAERSFQVGIVAYTQNREILARIRFRQARSAFKEATELLESSDGDLLSPPVEVNVQPGRELVSTALSELPVIPEAETVALADAGIENLNDLESSEEAPWLPTVVETVVDKETTNERVTTILTLLSWWNDTDSYEFDTTAAVSRRREQADYGFTRSS